MIRNVTPQDACAIVDIYNHYITLSTATFEITSLDEAEMRQRILAITSHYPYFVEETDGKITGYCYAHPWKERAAYAQTWETTVYVAPGEERKGIGTRLMEKLIEACRPMKCRSLIACITELSAISLTIGKSRTQICKIFLANFQNNFPVLNVRRKKGTKKPLYYISIKRKMEKSFHHIFT